MARENEKERDRHLYFIGLDAVMPVKLMSQLSRGRRERWQGESKRPKTMGGGGRRETEGNAKEKNGEI